jgi:hypothetical protein
MPRFYFDVDDGRGAMADGEGSELADERTAVAEARRALGEMARDLLVSEGDDLEVGIVVRDEDGQTHATIVLSVQVRREPR